jgi:hypothetical protein
MLGSKRGVAVAVSYLDIVVRIVVQRQGGKAVCHSTRDCCIERCGHAVVVCETGCESLEELDPDGVLCKVHSAHSRATGSYSVKGEHMG